MTTNQKAVLCAVNGAKEKLAHLASCPPGMPLHHNDVQSCAEQRDALLRVYAWLANSFTRGDTFDRKPPNE